MRKMQEKEFDELPRTTIDAEAHRHEVVKLYVNGTHTDYGCIKCKMKSLVKEDFEN